MGDDGADFDLRAGGDLSGRGEGGSVLAVRVDCLLLKGLRDGELGGEELGCEDDEAEAEAEVDEDEDAEELALGLLGFSFFTRKPFIDSFSPHLSSKCSSCKTTAKPRAEGEIGNHIRNLHTRRSRCRRHYSAAFSALQPAGKLGQPAQ